MAEEEDRVEPIRRSARLALSEIQVFEPVHETPNKNVSADEMIIIQRGPRRKPITWSPVELDRTPASQRSPKNNSSSSETLPKRPMLNSKLRRRLILSPTKNSTELGSAIARKLRALPKLSMELAQDTPKIS